MGADLFIEKDPNEDTRYFRDSYNGSNVLWKLGLSYWNIDESIPSIGKIEDQKLNVEQVKILLDEVLKRRSILEDFIQKLDRKWLKDNYLLTNNTVVSWEKYFIEKYEKLVSFLKHAIELDSQIIWGV